MTKTSFFKFSPRIQAGICAVAALGILGMPGTVRAELAKEDVQAIVKDYLFNNPEVVVDALEQYRIQKEKEDAEATLASIQKHKGAFVDGSPSVGAENPKVTVIEFFDYNCGYCKRALPGVQAALKKNDDVLFVFQEMPILAPSSEMAAKWALAAHKQGKYFEFHSALMEFTGNKTEEVLTKIAGDLKLDVDQLKKDAASAEIAASIEKSKDAAREIGIQGTPAFIVNDEIYRGYLGDDGLQDAIEKERAKL